MPNPNKPGGKQQPKREHDIHVRGTILTDLSPNEEKRRNSEREEDAAAHKAERKEDRGRERHKIWLERFTLLAVVIYAGITFWQGCLTRKIAKLTEQTYETSQRPYVGIDTVTPWHLGRNKEGKVTASTVRTPESENLEVKAAIKNFGPVPGGNFSHRWSGYMDGVEIQTDTPTAKNEDIFPGQTVELTAQIGSADYLAVVENRKEFRVVVWIGYDGPAGHYTDCETFAYRGGSRNSFEHMGRVGCD